MTISPKFYSALLFLYCVSLVGCIKYDDPPIDASKGPLQFNTPCESTLLNNQVFFNFLNGSSAEGFELDSASCAEDGDVEYISSNGEIKINLFTPPTESRTYELGYFLSTDHEASMLFTRPDFSFEYYVTSGTLYVSVARDGTKTYEWCDIEGAVLGLDNFEVLTSGRIICE
jgi:hypothetical protein